MLDSRAAFEKCFPEFAEYEQFWIVWSEAWKAGQVALEIELLSHMAQLEKQIYGGRVN